MSDAIAAAVRQAGFVELGRLEAHAEDVAHGVDPGEIIVLVGNAGAAMFERFEREGNDAGPDALDRWTRAVLTDVAREIEARVIFPFDKPPAPFLTWAKRAGQTFTSPLGLNIHPHYGLWHAYRGAFVVAHGALATTMSKTHHPCEKCNDKPCLSTCPVGAFTNLGYDVDGCVNHIGSSTGADCAEFGCLARRACPVGAAYLYSPEQARFHMKAFISARMAKR